MFLQTIALQIHSRVKSVSPWNASIPVYRLDVDYTMVIRHLPSRQALGKEPLDAEEARKLLSTCDTEGVEAVRLRELWRIKYNLFRMSTTSRNIH
jgi:hypothetical protein